MGVFCHKHVCKLLCNEGWIIRDEGINVDQIKGGIGGEDTCLSALTVSAQDLSTLCGEHNAAEMLCLCKLVVLGSPENLQLHEAGENHQPADEENAVHNEQALFNQAFSLCF